MAVLLALSCTGCGNSADVFDNDNTPQPEEASVLEFNPIDESAPESAEKPSVENTGFEVSEGYQYYLYDHYSLIVKNDTRPVLGMNFPYGWYNSGRVSIRLEDIYYVCEYSFNADFGLNYDEIQDYGYFINLEGKNTELCIGTIAKRYFGREEGYQVELQVNGEYTVDTPYGQWTIQQVVLWQDWPELIEADETKTVDGTDWYGHYAEVATVHNGEHEICIWLKYSDKDSTYLKEIFADIL